MPFRVGETRRQVTGEGVATYLVGPNEMFVLDSTIPSVYANTAVSLPNGALMESQYKLCTIVRTGQWWRAPDGKNRCCIAVSEDAQFRATTGDEDTVRVPAKEVLASWALIAEIPYGGDVVRVLKGDRTIDYEDKVLNEDLSGILLARGTIVRSAMRGITWCSAGETPVALPKVDSEIRALKTGSASASIEQGQLYKVLSVSASEQRIYVNTTTPELSAKQHFLRLGDQGIDWVETGRVAEEATEDPRPATLPAAVVAGDVWQDTNDGELVLIDRVGEKGVYFKWASLHKPNDILWEWPEFHEFFNKREVFVGQVRVLAHVNNEKWRKLRAKVTDISYEQSEPRVTWELLENLEGEACAGYRKTYSLTQLLKFTAVEQEKIEAAATEARPEAEKNNETEEAMEATKKVPDKKTNEPDYGTFKNVGVDHGASTRIVLPEGMSLVQGAAWLKRLDEENDRTVAIHHEINAYPLEGAYALVRALRERFGFISLEATPGFFRDDPPHMVGLDISPTERVQVPWGRYRLPGSDGFIDTGLAVQKDGAVKFTLNGETKRRHEETFNEIAALVKQYVTEHSLYKGKAIRIEFPEDPKQIDPSYTPKFWDTSRISASDLVFPRAVQDLVDVTLFAPIEHTARARRMQIPLKRGILLEGPYGTGKTLTAGVAAKKCAENGWTFIYLEKASHLKRAIMLARQYQPAVIFAEDIDQEIGGNERDEAVNSILNTIDGIDAKTTEIIVVLTTNHVDRINRAMLRPGRLDAVIPVRAPDAEAVQRVIRLYGRGLVDPNTNLTEVGRLLDGQIPATIREVIERAKLSAARRPDTDWRGDTLVADDLVVAANSIMAQLEHMKAPAVDNRTDAQVLADGMKVAAEIAVRGPLPGKTVNALASSNGSTAGGAHLQIPNVVETEITKSPDLDVG